MLENGSVNVLKVIPQVNSLTQTNFSEEDPPKTRALSMESYGLLKVTSFCSKLNLRELISEIYE